LHPTVDVTIQYP